MPELPEVEVMCARTNAWAAGRKIDGVKVHRQNGKYHVGDITGHGVIGVFRRGKQMIFQLTGDKVLVAHNAMSGYWDAHDDPWTFDYVEGSREPTEKDVRVELILDGGRRLRFHDSRLFGHMYVATWAEVEKELGCLGPEAIKTPRMFPLAPVLNTLDMVVILGGSKKPVKQLLLEQERLAGVGNIYAAEALWKASVHPLRRGDSLSTQELSDVSDAIREVLNGALGRNLDYSGLKVYRSETCPRCKGGIGKIEVAKRMTYFCPVCQVHK